MQRYLPALVDPIPAVSTDRGVIFTAYFRNWDLPVPGSPTNKRCDSPGGRVKMPKFSTDQILDENCI